MIVRVFSFHPWPDPSSTRDVLAGKFGAPKTLWDDDIVSILVTGRTEEAGVVQVLIGLTNETFVIGVLDATNLVCSLHGGQPTYRFA